MTKQFQKYEFRDVIVKFIVRNPADYDYWRYVINIEYRIQNVINIEYRVCVCIAN